MIQNKKILYILFLLLATQAYAFSLKLPSFLCKKSKTPQLKFITFAEDTKTLLTNITIETTKISEKEKKGDDFIYKYTVAAKDYNSASDSIAIPYNMQGKPFYITNYLTPLIMKKFEPPKLITIKGIIYKPDHLAFKNCAIEVITNAISQPFLNQKSDTNGAFAFTNLPQKPYIISVTPATNSFLSFKTNFTPKSNTLQYNLKITLLSKTQKKTNKTPIATQTKKKHYPPKKIVKKRKKKKPLTAYQKFLKNHYSIAPYTTLILNHKNILLKKKQQIIVGKGATLILKNSHLYSKTKWKGILVKPKATLIIRKSSLSKASTLIQATSAKKIFIDSSEVFKNTKALQAFYTPINIENSTFQNNTNALYLLSSPAVIRNTKFLHNNIAFTAKNTKSTLKNCYIAHNKQSAVFKNCKGLIDHTSISENDSNGLTFDNSNFKIQYSDIYGNKKNGVFSINSNPEIYNNNIFNNKFYAVKDGGIVDSCFIGYNNFSDKIDNSPSMGKKDNQKHTVSNTFIKQLFNVDSITNPQLQKISFQGEKH